MTMLSQIALRQAEERTKLVVDCAGLVRRLEELNNEIAEYDQWQRYPNHHYKSNVQIRFEEARLREAAAARRALGTDELPMASLRGSPATSPPLSPKPAHGIAPRPRRPGSALHLASEQLPTCGSPSPPGKEADHQLSVVHLQSALRAADFEAEVWRHRAHEMEQASEREREKVKELLKFELDTALRAAEQERAQMMSRLDDSHRENRSLRERIEDHEAQYKKFATLVVTRERELDIAQSEITQLRKDAVTQEENRSKLDVEIRSLRVDRDTQAREAMKAKQYLSEYQLLADQVSAKQKEVLEVQEQLRDSQSKHQVIQASLSKLHAEKHHQANEWERTLDNHKNELGRLTQALGKAVSDSETLRADMEALRLDRDAKANVLVTAKMTAETLKAKCENLEAALNNSTSKQAELALEKDALQQRIDHFQSLKGKLMSNMEEAGELLYGDVKKGHLPDLPPSLASTMNSSKGAVSLCSQGSSPQTPSALPLIRPGSADVQSRKEGMETW